MHSQCFRLIRCQQNFVSHRTFAFKSSAFMCLFTGVYPVFIITFTSYIILDTMNRDSWMQIGSPFPIFSFLYSQSVFLDAICNRLEYDFWTNRCMDLHKCTLVEWIDSSYEFKKNDTRNIYNFLHQHFYGLILAKIFFLIFSQIHVSNDEGNRLKNIEKSPRSDLPEHVLNP